MGARLSKDNRGGSSRTGQAAPGAARATRPAYIAGMSDRIEVGTPEARPGDEGSFPHTRRDARLRRMLATSLLVGFGACGAVDADREAPAVDPLAPTSDDQPFVVVLGVGQDGGYPQAGMKDPEAWGRTERRRLPVSLAIVDPASGERWMVEATPAFPEQLEALEAVAPHEDVPGLAGVLLTHAHVGHYAGLIHLGREIIGASGVPVYAMPRMETFLRSNGPWDQLVALGNIEIQPLVDGVPTALNARIRVTPMTVPHRDEYSETVGYLIEGPERSVFFLPDIDKWEAWDARGTRVEDILARVDAAYLDATFFADGEVPGRAMAEIPHPFVSESMDRFGALPTQERAKIRFIHVNRTNPVGWPSTPEWDAAHRAGFRVAVRGERVGL
jgi:pyrroloquinoline quinone biosynthesis protein B